MKKILLLGEFSGLYSNLKDGLIKLGHEVTIASSGDGFKKISSDIKFMENPRSKFELLKYSIDIFQKSRKFRNFDIVQFIAPRVFAFGALNSFIQKRIISNNSKVFLTAAGQTLAVTKYWLNQDGHKLQILFNDVGKYEKKGNSFPYSNSQVQWEYELFEMVNGIIPVSYTYHEPLKGLKSLRPIIPIPINTDKFHFETNIVESGKLKIFHGLSRYGFKGTHYVEQAFEILKKKYPNDLELVIDGRKPFNEYIEILKKFNVIIDQTSSNYIGVNGLLAMAMGKVIIGGAEPDALNAMGIEKCPAINIQPNVKNIVNAIETLLEQKSSIEYLGNDSRQYIEDHHQYIKVAERYVKEWDK